MSRGWFGERVRHGLAAKGIKTARERFQQFHRQNRATLRELGKRDPDNEWIADIDFENGKLILEDIQHGDSHSSVMMWDGDDPLEAVGFVHYHPQGDDKLSADDFHAIYEVHRRRQNGGPSYLGLVVGDRLKIWAFAPAKDRTDIRDDNVDAIQREMEKSGEFVKVLDRRL